MSDDTSNDTRRFVETCFGTAHGWLCTAIGLKPYRNENNKYEHEIWRESAFAWPAQADEAISYITRSAELGDVYMSPYPRKEPSRAKGNAGQHNVAHADFDGDEIDEAKVAALGAFVIPSGSPGHVHVYVPLAWPVTPAQHEALCRGLAAHLGSSDAKFSDNDLLRPPGTLNYKATLDGFDPSPVTVVWSGNGQRDPFEVAELLGVDLANPGTNGDTGRRQPRTERESDPVNLDLYPSVREALDGKTDDRSADTYKVVAACRKAGLTLAETQWVVGTRDDLKERLDGRGDDDLATIWLKLDDEQRMVERMVTPSAPTIDGAGLLDKVLHTLTRYVVFPGEAAVIAVVLWIVATHALPAWQHATRLVIRSPQKRCGKSRLLDIVRLLCFNPMGAVDMSTPVIFRSIGDDDKSAPTLLIDEADALFGTKSKAEQHEDLRGILNAGFQRDRGVWRCVGPNQEPTEFNTFAMCVLAAIKTLPDTVIDRAVVIDLKRRQPGETVARFRMRRHTAPLLDLRAQLTAWVRAGERLAILGDAEPDMPDSVEDRAQDAWEPLIAIADAAGGAWPELARAACEDLCGAAADDDNEDDQLLSDIEDIFTHVDGEFIPSVQLVGELNRREESPWSDIGLTIQRLAKLLRPFGVKPRHGPGKVSRGYWRSDFADSFRRYNRPKSS